MADACVSETDWFRGGVLVMVCSGMSGYYKADIIVINGNLTGVYYRDELLAQHVQLLMRPRQDVEIFQCDNARWHTAEVCTAFLLNAKTEVMDWPVKSPERKLFKNLCRQTK